MFIEEEEIFEKKQQTLNLKKLCCFPRRGVGIDESVCRHLLQLLLGLLREIKLREPNEFMPGNRITVRDAGHNAVGVENVRLLLMV